VKCFVGKIPNKYPLWVRRDMKRTFLQFFQSSVIINIVLFSSLLVLTEISRESIFLLLCLLLLLHRFRSGYLLRSNKLSTYFLKINFKYRNFEINLKITQWTSGVNLNNIYHEAFTLVGPKSAKRQWWLDYLFANLGSGCLKAACKMLVKLTAREVRS